jgi:hypothetical protein
LGLLTAQRLTSRDFGRQFLELLSEKVPALAPEKYGNYEPVRTTFDLNRIEGVLDLAHE